MRFTSVDATKRKATIIVDLKIHSSGPRLVCVFPSKFPPPKALPREPSDC